MEKLVRIKLIKSFIGRPKDQRLTLRALGFLRVNQVVTKPDNKQIRGMIDKVSHLIEVIE